MWSWVLCCCCGVGVDGLTSIQGQHQTLQSRQLRVVRRACSAGKYCKVTNRSVNLTKHCTLSTINAAKSHIYCSRLKVHSNSTCKNSFKSFEHAKFWINIANGWTWSNFGTINFAFQLGMCIQAFSPVSVTIHTYIHAHYQGIISCYRIDGKFGGDFNLASWRLISKSPN